MRLVMGSPAGNRALEILAHGKHKRITHLKPSEDCAYPRDCPALAMDRDEVRGFCLKRLVDLPMGGTGQWRAISLQRPALP
jgi:hypothetical protein